MQGLPDAVEFLRMGGTIVYRDVTIANGVMKAGEACLTMAPDGSIPPTKRPAPSPPSLPLPAWSAPPLPTQVEQSPPRPVQETPPPQTQAASVWENDDEPDADADDEDDEDYTDAIGQADDASPNHSGGPKNSTLLQMMHKGKFPDGTRISARIVRGRPKTVHATFARGLLVDDTTHVPFKYLYEWRRMHDLCERSLTLHNVRINDGAVTLADIGDQATPPPSSDNEDSAEPPSDAASSPPRRRRCRRRITPVRKSVPLLDLIDRCDLPDGTRITASARHKRYHATLRNNVLVDVATGQKIASLREWETIHSLREGAMSMTTTYVNGVEDATIWEIYTGEKSVPPPLHDSAPPK
jgi:hypothetical protein